MTGPNVAPEVVDFGDDDEELLHQRLDELLGDEILDVEAVKVVKKEPAKSAPGPAVFTVDDDLEISFEFDVEGQDDGEAKEEPPVVEPTETTPPAQEAKPISLDEKPGMYFGRNGSSSTHSDEIYSGSFSR